MPIFDSVKCLLLSLHNTFFPRYCCVCGRRLMVNEEDLCISYASSG